MRGEQLTFTTLGGAVVTVPKRGKHYVQQRGYVAPPGTGPAGETCGSCQHIKRVAGGARVFRKCGLNQARWTGGPGSDILAGAPACRKWAKP